MSALFGVFRHGQSFKGTRGEGIIKALYEGKVKDYIRCTECGYSHGRAVMQAVLFSLGVIRLLRYTAALYTKFERLKPRTMYR